ncbi:DUF6167 family protein [Arthrobacter sp. CAU 1506]|uniref:DUF6167 family protein n=1 Tax=Arthrobacter sp. CAU 1506 TaxID=2560052 RepID=UPI00197AAAC3|nr:DUF6167 family protein [Arthrobacter sp. CAU 1506]
MKRMIWMAAGVAIGVLAVRKVSQTREALGPVGLNRALAQVADSVANFADAVRDGMQERESDLRLALGIDSADDVRTR